MVADIRGEWASPMECPPSWVAVCWMSNTSGAVDVLDLGTQQRIAQIAAVSSPRYMTVAEASKAYVSNLFDGTITMINLADGLVLSNAPPLETPSWRQAFLALERPMRVAAGDELQVAIHAAGNGAVWRWQVTHRSSAAGSGTADQSTFFGRLMSPATLRKSAGDHRPMVRVVLDRTVSDAPLSDGGFAPDDGLGYALVEKS